MKLNQVAVQLYTLRDHCKTAPEFAATLKKVRAIGYTAIQVSGVGPIPEAEIVSIAQGEGLTICATHESSDLILNEPLAVVERLQKLGCRHTAYPYPAGIDFSNAEHIRTLARKLDHAGEVLHRHGLVLSYHNHAIEFVRFGEKTVLDYIFESTNPLHLQAEIDTFWVQYGGGNPVEWCARLKNRLPHIHLKDYGFTPENKHTWCEIGKGTLDFKAIIAAAENSGCEWFIVEQDTCPGDPFESVRLSFDYIQSHLISP